MEASLAVDVDGLERTLSKRHKQSTRRKSTRSKPSEPSHVHPKCSRCNALVGRDGKTLNQPKISVTCAAVRRTQSNKAYNPADFEILLLPPTDQHPFYLLPESYMHIGESGELAAQRSLSDVASLIGMRAHCVAFNGQTGRRLHHTVTSLFALSCAVHERPAAGKFCNLFHVVSNKGAYPLGHGHRELVYQAAGFLRLRCKQETVDSFFTASSRTLVGGVKNALFGQHFPTHASEKPLITFQNPHFQAEPLRALARGRRPSTGSAFFARPRDKAVDGTHAATDTESPIRPALSASSLPAGPAVNGHVDPPSPTPLAASLPVAASFAATSQGHDGQPASPLATSPDGKALVPSVSSMHRTLSTRQQHLTALRDDDDDEDQDDDDDVVLALRGLNSKSSSARRPSSQSQQSNKSSSVHSSSPNGEDDDTFGAHHRVPDGAFNPLADDLNADFTNPLAEEA